MRPFEFEHGALPGSLELAYLGDTIYDLYVRARLVCAGGHVRQMHREAVKIVCAQAQARAFRRIEDQLTDREREVARRARNAHQSPTRNANPAEYHLATALEALTGYLFVTGQQARMEALLVRLMRENDAPQEQFARLGLKM